MIPASAKSIGEVAFPVCWNLKDVCFHGNAPSSCRNILGSSNKVVHYYLNGTLGWSGCFAARWHSN